MSTHEELIKLASSFVGVTESGGANKGPEVEMFQKAVDGKAVGEPWCCAFVQFCVKATDANVGTKNVLAQTEHCVTLWNQTPPEARLEMPIPGCLIVWEKHDQGKPTGLGHVGIVTKVLAGEFVQTIEGNTGAGPGVEREGDGVYLRKRPLNPVGYMRIKGFLNPWPA